MKLKILLLKQTSRILIVKGLSAIEWIISNFNSVESLNLKSLNLKLKREEREERNRQ